MKEELHGEGIPARGKPAGRFCWQRNEIYDLVQQVVGPTSIAVYGNLTRRTFGYIPTFKCTMRELAASMGQSPATVNREVKVLEYLGVVRLKVGRGSRATEFELTDLEVLGRTWGATYNQHRRRYDLPKAVKERLSDEVDQLRRSLQGKADKPQVDGVSSGGLPPTRVRDTVVSPKRRARLSEETAAGSQLFKENRTQENDPSPTPSHIGDLWKSKDLSDERTVGLSLKRFRDLFCGAMDQMKDHLVNPSRPQLSHLEDGYEEWQRFGFESLGLVAVRETGAAVRLVLSAFDPGQAEAGLEKYRATWDAAVRRWFPCKVEIELQPIPGRRGEGYESLRPFDPQTGL